MKFNILLGIRISLIFLCANAFFANAYAQVDSAKLKSDTIAIDNKRKELTRVANEVIDHGVFKRQEDTLAYQKRKVEEELEKLELDKIKNKEIIRLKRREEARIDNEIQLLNKEKKELLGQIKDAEDYYEKLKQSTIIEVKFSDSLSKQADSIINQAATIDKQAKSIEERTNKAQAELNDLLAEIAKKEDSLEAVATIKLKTDGLVFRSEKTSSFNDTSFTNLLFLHNIGAVPFYDLKKKLSQRKPPLNVDSIKIIKVNLSVKEGRIVEIVARTDKGIFRNTESQIDLVHFSERRYSDRLYKDDENFHSSFRSFIYPGDAIIYEPIRSFSAIPYSEFEITLTADSSNNQYIIRESTSINTYFDVAVFTDIKGIAGEANGLAQITGSAKFITSTRNVKNNPLMLLHYVAFTGGLSKFDNDFKGTFVSKDDSVNRKDLFQRAQYSLGVKVNLLHWVRSPYPTLWIQDIQLNAGFNFIGSRIADTLRKANDTAYRTVTHNQFYIEPIFSLARQKNFSMTLGLPLYYQNLKASAGIANSAGEWWICPSINLMYYSNRDSKNKIFFRYNHFVNLNDKKQAFMQLQLGFAASLTNIVQGK